MMQLLEHRRDQEVSMINRKSSATTYNQSDSGGKRRINPEEKFKNWAVSSSCVTMEMSRSVYLEAPKTIISSNVLDSNKTANSSQIYEWEDDSNRRGYPAVSRLLQHAWLWNSIVILWCSTTSNMIPKINILICVSLYFYDNSLIYIFSRMIQEMFLLTLLIPRYQFHSLTVHEKEQGLLNKLVIAKHEIQILESQSRRFKMHI